MLKTVTTELKRAGDVVSSSEAHSDRVGSVVDPLLLLFLDEDESINGTAAVQRGLSRWIRHEADLVEVAEGVHLGETRILAQMREQRDLDQDTLYRIVLTVRSTVESSAGSGKSSQLVGLDPRLGNVDPVTLRRYARTAMEVLTDAAFVPPEGTVVGTGGTPQATAAVIKPALEAFESSLAKIERQQRRVEETQRLKDEALARLRRVTVNGAKIFEGFYNLAGEGFHAERLRKTRTRSSSPSPEEPAVEAGAVDES